MATTDTVEIDRIVEAFYAAFTNRNGATPNVDLLDELFLPEGIIVKNSGDAPEIYDLAGFIEPRRKLLTQDR